MKQSLNQFVIVTAAKYSPLWRGSTPFPLTATKILVIVFASSSFLILQVRWLKLRNVSIWPWEPTAIVLTQKWADAGKQEMCYWLLKYLCSHCWFWPVKQPLQKSGIGISTKQLYSGTSNTLSTALGKKSPWSRQKSENKLALSVENRNLFFFPVNSTVFHESTSEMKQ